MKRPAANSSRMLFLLAGVLAGGCLVIPRSKAQEPTQAAPIGVNSSMVNVYAVVQDRRGHLIRNRSKTDFEVTDGAAPQAISYFSRETEAPLSLGLLIDTSASQEHLLSTEQQTAKIFVASVLGSGDKAFFMHFDMDVGLLVDFTNDTAALSHAVDAVRINETGQSILREPQRDSRPGGTHLYDAVFLASNELMKTREGRKVLVIVTDGEDQGSRIDLHAAVAAAEKADVIVYAIIVNDPDFYVVTGVPCHGPGKMVELSRETGGRTIRVRTIGDLGQAFAQVAAELRSQYLLGYLPSNLAHDGSFRRISVKVRGQQYAVKARRGYYAPSQ